MALKDITTIEETEQLSADATFYTADGGAFRRAGMDAVKDALGLALESTATKQALLNCFQHVAWIDEHGQDYYDALYDALYNIPVSISATFVQGSNVIYNTDPLSVLRQYLVVRATYEDETVQTVTAYTLSGTLTVGTSTITAAYKGKTATFEVTVTQSEAFITASYTPGTETVYTVFDVNDLKSNLVVTFFASPNASGQVLSDSDYSLIGTLTEGTSSITAVYNGLTAVFSVPNVVDFYNVYHWNSGTDTSVATIIDTSTWNTTVNGVVHTYVNSDIDSTRKSMWMKYGTLPVLYKNMTVSPYYGIPIPADATGVTITITPNTYKFNAMLRGQSEEGDLYGGTESGWVTGSYTASSLPLYDGTHKATFLALNTQGVAGDFSAGYPVFDIVFTQ